MPALLLAVIRFVRLLLSGHQAVAIENAALRLQIAAFRRKRKRLVLTSFDRLFWVSLSRQFVSRPALFVASGPFYRPDKTLRTLDKQCSPSAGNGSESGRN